MRWLRGLNWQPPPEHSGEVIGAIVGGLLGLFVIIVGFWRALVVAMFIAIGVAVGRYIDVNEELKENIARRFRQPRGR